jgi:hypothetical protein
MADKKIKLEAVPETPADLAPKIAKKVNEAGVAEGTKKKLLTLMGKPETEAKLLKEDAAKSAAEDLKKFKEKVLDKPADIVAVEAIRADVHDKILAALGGEFEAGGDKGEDVYIRYSGRTFTIPTILDSVEARGGLTSYASLLGIGNIVLPWSHGGSVRDGA